MTDVIFREFAKRFEEQGCTIERISSGPVMLFNIGPFTESFLGWNKVNLSHFTVLDCIPLAELSEEEILSGSPKLKSVIIEAVKALKIEEENMKILKKRSLVLSAEKHQMIWL
jgi:hypothetical protein